jgi:hypothetical protein
MFHVFFLNYLPLKASESLSALLRVCGTVHSYFYVPRRERERERGEEMGKREREKEERERERAKERARERVRVRARERKEKEQKRVGNYISKPPKPK